MYKYAIEIDENDIEIEKLDKKHNDITKTFECGNDYMDEFLKKNAINDRLSTTHLFIDKKNNLLLGFFSLSASGVSLNMSNPNVERSKKNRFNISAIEISYFALNKPFKHMFFDEITEKENENYFLSDILFEKVIEYIIELRKYIGFRNIILYSVPNSKDENRPLDIYERFNFASFTDYMEKNNKRFLEGCIPLFKEI